MRVKCHEEGGAAEDGEPYPMTPAEAAELYVEEWHDDEIGPVNVVVVFVVTPVITYEAREVASFNPNHKEHAS